MSVEESRVVANGIEHHVLRWGAGPQTVVLCHGFLDVAASFDAVANALADTGEYTVVSFDWRGHGRSGWIGAGGYYHFADYILDMNELLPKLASEPVHLVGHSMAGTSCTMFAAARPELVRSLTLIEGLGPPEHMASEPVTRLRNWLDQMGRLRAGAPRPIRDASEAISRMRVQNPELDDDLGAFLVEQSTVKVEDGLLWSFDPMHKTLSPIGFRADRFCEFLAEIEAPTFIVAGERGYRLKDESERMGHLKNHRFKEIADVGHMIHWFKADELATALSDFFKTA